MSPAQSPTPANVPDRAHRSPGAAWLSRAVAPVIAVIAILASLLGVAPHAQAADSFVYWGYWQQTNGSWVYSQVGAATANPADGTVEGWRWMIDEGGAKPRPPRLTATFAQLCGSTPAEAGKKRVGLVVDFGRDVDGGVEAEDQTADGGDDGTADDQRIGARVLLGDGSIRHFGVIPCLRCGVSYDDICYNVVARRETTPLAASSARGETHY